MFLLSFVFQILTDSGLAKLDARASATTFIESATSYIQGVVLHVNTSLGLLWLYHLFQLWENAKEKEYPTSKKSIYVPTKGFIKLEHVWIGLFELVYCHKHFWACSHDMFVSYFQFISINSSRYLMNTTYSSYENSLNLFYLLL